MSITLEDKQTYRIRVKIYFKTRFLQIDGCYPSVQSSSFGAGCRCLHLACHDNQTGPDLLEGRLDFAGADNESVASQLGADCMLYSMSSLDVVVGGTGCLICMVMENASNLSINYKIGFVGYP